MLSHAWDMEDNVRSSTVYRVPWVRVTRAGGIQYLGDDPRNVYENNANQGARRTRAMLEAIIPPEIVALAVRICREAGEASVKSRPLPEQRAGAVKAFAELGVTQRQVEDKVGKPADEWLAVDLVFLKTIKDSLVERTTTVAEEFGPAPSRKRAALDAQPDREAEDAGEPATAEDTPAAPPVEATQPADTPPADTVATPPGGAMSAETGARVSAWFEEHKLAGAAVPRRKRRDWIVREVLGVAGEEYGIGDLTEEAGRDLLDRLTSLPQDDLDRFGIGGE
jgi:hypothetical protein